MLNTVCRAALITTAALLKVKALRDAMMAGGFGGCTINLIAKTATASFKKAVSEAYKIKFDKGCSLYFVELSDGTGIIA